MKFLSDIKQGWMIIVYSFRLWRRYPELLMPLIAQQLISAPIILHLVFGEDMFYDQHPFFVLFLSIFCIALLLTFCCLILLELLEQLERNQPIDLWAATWAATKNDLLRSLPLVLGWSVILFVIVVVEAFLAKARERTRLAETPENIARILADQPRTTTLREELLDALQKGIRMVVFLILPGIAWEGRGVRDATRRGLSILRLHGGAFLSNFAMAIIVEGFVFLPAVVVFFLSDDGVVIADWVWFVTIGYIFFAWSYTIYTEQMLGAELYLWHLRWEKQINVTVAGEFARIEDVDPPSLFDGVPELLNQVIQTQDTKKI